MRNKEPNSRIVAILGGGDWNDASVDHLVLSRDVDLEAAHIKYNDWVNHAYRPATDGVKPEWMTFADYLIEFCGARYCNDSEIEIY